MAKRKIIKKGDGYKIYLTDKGERVVAYSPRFNPIKLRSKVVDKDKKKKTRSQIKRDFKKEDASLEIYLFEPDFVKKTLLAEITVEGHEVARYKLCDLSGGNASEKIGTFFKQVVNVTD